MNVRLFAAFLFSFAFSARAAELKAGAAAVNITPPLGQPIVGGWESPPATHIHDELHARCLVLDDGQTRLAFAVCDNVGIPREVFDTARKLIHDETGLPADHVLMAATHTHSAPASAGVFQTATNTDYVPFLAQRIADGVQRAAANLAPATLGWGAGAVPGEVFNRRWKLKPGVPLVDPFGRPDQVRMNPAPGSPDLVEPAGPTDPEVVVLSIRSPDGRPIALLANYSQFQCR